MFFPDQIDNLKDVIAKWSCLNSSERISAQAFTLLDYPVIGLYASKFLSNPSYRTDDYEPYLFLMFGHNHHTTIDKNFKDKYFDDTRLAKTYLVIGRIIHTYLTDLERAAVSHGVKDRLEEQVGIQEALMRNSLLDFFQGTTIPVSKFLDENAYSPESFSQGLRDLFLKNSEFTSRCPFGKRAKQIMGINPVRISPTEVVLGSPLSGALPAFIYNEMFGQPKIGPSVKLLERVM